MVRAKVILPEMLCARSVSDDVGRFGSGGDAQLGALLGVGDGGEGDAEVGDGTPEVWRGEGLAVMSLWMVLVGKDSPRHEVGGHATATWGCGSLKGQLTAPGSKPPPSPHANGLSKRRVASRIVTKSAMAGWQPRVRCPASSGDVRWRKVMTTTTNTVFPKRTAGQTHG